MIREYSLLTLFSDPAEKKFFERVRPLFYHSSGTLVSRHTVNHQSVNLFLGLGLSGGIPMTSVNQGGLVLYGMLHQRVRRIIFLVLWWDFFLLVDCYNGRSLWRLAHPVFQVLFGLDSR